MKTKFPLDHIVKVQEKEVWIKCECAITAMGIGALVNKFYPGFTAKLCSEDHLNTLKNQLAN